MYWRWSRCSHDSGKIRFVKVKGVQRIIMSIKRIMVIGGGTMGLGIAQAAAQNGFEVLLKDINLEVAEKGKQKIEDTLKRILNKGKIVEQEMNSTLHNIECIANFKKVNRPDFIIESVSEDINIKKAVLKEVDQFYDSDVRIASNTTSLSITDLSSVIRKSKNFIGMHFFNPVWAMKLVEITSGLSTSKETIEATKDLVQLLGKIPVVAMESPGGITSRILGAMLNEAIFALAEGIASAENIDIAMKLGANLPIGPLHLVDIIGLDIHLAKMETLYKEFGDPKYRPHPLLRKMIRAGYLGKKSGKGFFSY